MKSSQLFFFSLFYFASNYVKTNLKTFAGLIFIVLTFQVTYGQIDKLTSNEIDKQISEISKASSDKDIEKIEYLIEAAKIIDYEEGLIKGKFKMLNVFFYRSDFNGMLALIREIEKLEIKDYEQMAMLAIHKSYANKALGIEKEELFNINEALKYAKRIEDADRMHYQLSIVYNRFSVYYDYKIPDSLIHYLKKELEELEQLSDQNPEKYSDIALNNINIGNFYLGVLKPKRLDLAEPFYLKVYDYRNTHPNIFKIQNIPILCGVGRFYYEKRNYKKAIELLTEVLRIETDKKNSAYRLYAYSVIADSYEGLKNHEEQVKYMKLYVALNDSLIKVSKKEVNQQFEKLVTDAEKNKDEEHNSAFNILLFSIISVGLFSILFLLCYLKRKKVRFEELINKIESENTKEKIVLKQDNAPEQEMMLLDNNSQESILASKEKSCQITDATIHTILSKLEKFERSDKYLKNEISLSYLASQLGTNTKYLSEIIKQHKGKSFSNYINGLRINYIAMLLYNDIKYREYKISYLAELSGFSSREVFAVVFKKETGVTPSYFIDNLKNNDISA